MTAFGRNFKLHGYVLTDMTPRDKVGNSKDLLLTRYIPLSAMILVSDSVDQATQPSSQNGSAGFPQQLSIFLAGAFAPHFGGMAQVTYTHSDDHFGMDNTDLRYANQTKLGNHDLLYGITLNNNPTVEDVWNSTPAWGFPWISSSSAVGPIASPVISGGLAQDVAGLGAYSLYANHLYTDVTLYRSEHGGASTPVTGTGYQYNISGAAPYWRAAWQQTWGSNYLEVGTYGIYMNSFPGAVTGPEDRYVDPSFDFQYERPFGANLLDAHGTYIHEKSDLGATFAAGGASTKSNYLNTFKLDSTYHWTNKYSATGALFSTTGNADALLYAQAPLTGSNNGHPNTSGFIAQFGYWPVQNIDLSAAYTGYFKFNGASNNYDGANRNASDNNSLYLALWVNF
ncbi:cytochrome C [Acidipila rosea]|uniref:cytochrome C n=1 Tax=Acidipila rosea TaxID=768535 RepID=UPI001050BD10|nr:cytochrome C [Acidipila rosea]MBW4046066.1 cytochrome C [Acidobacteriota bacterium]